MIVSTSIPIFVIYYRLFSFVEAGTVWRSHALKQESVGGTKVAKKASSRPNQLKKRSY